MNERIVILGGSGFIGSALINVLKKSYSGEIVCVSRHAIPLNNVIVRRGDICSKKTLVSVIERGDTVVNCTGQISNNIGECAVQNSIGVFNIAHAVAVKKARLVHLSSVNVYGSRRHATEESECRPETSYASFKYIAELILKNEISYKHLTILRLSNVYGKGSKGIIDYIYESVKKNKTLVFPTNDTLFRHYMFLEDCVKIIKDVCIRDDISGIFNVTGSEAYSIKELLKIIKKKKKRIPAVLFSKNKPLENIYTISTRKLKVVYELSFTKRLEEYFSFS